KWIARDGSGKPSGIVEQDGTRTVAAKILAPKDKFESSSLAMIRDWNRAGLTAVGSAGCPAEQYEKYREWERQGRLSMRVFCIEGFLNTIEQVDKEYPVRNLRWTLIHLDQINASHIERMRKLGMYAAVHTRPTVLGGLFNEIHGERSYDMPPLKLVQDSGITWGFGTDTTVVNQYRPFTTLYWAVTGKMV